LNTWQQVLLWLNAVWVAERDPDRREAWGRAAPAIRMLLRAMAVAARMDQGVTPAFGTRQLARMSGYDHTTVAKHLKRLREEAHPLVERIVPGRGKQGDRYVLLVPEPYRADAVARMWRGGRIETTHQALNLEGACVALTHEALSSAPTRAADVARLALLSRTSTVQALRTLAALGLADRTAEGWVRRDRPLKEVAIETGREDEYQATLAEHQAEREAWWGVIASWGLPAATDDDRPARTAKPVLILLSRVRRPTRCRGRPAPPTTSRAEPSRPMTRARRRASRRRARSRGSCSWSRCSAPW
ncbi:hypothetical protein, partial [Nonomuraea angiospora]|uniref:hypothetical protein n=1 Tax=Nonomuraea angiospora TaxID=46172 RepID=UPI0029AD2C20